MTEPSSPVVTENTERKAPNFLARQEDAEGRCRNASIGYKMRRWESPVAWKWRITGKRKSGQSIKRTAGFGMMFSTAIKLQTYQDHFSGLTTPKIFHPESRPKTFRTFIFINHATVIKVPGEKSTAVDIRQLPPEREKSNEWRRRPNGAFEAGRNIRATAAINLIQCNKTGIK